MSRNSSGNYSLPSGNPVVAGTVINSTWANPTLADISTELTSSLDRSGRGGMLAKLANIDGTAAAPAITFSSELGSGIYRLGANDIGFAVGGVLHTQYTVGIQTIQSASAAATIGPIHKIYRNSASPAASDFIGAQYFDGQNAASEQTTYASLEGQITSVTDGAEGGLLLGKVMVAGTLTTVATLTSGGLNGVLGATTPAAITGTALALASGATITGFSDDVTLAGASATESVTERAVKTYVDAAVATVDTLSEVLALGNTTGGTDLAVSTGDDITFADSSKAIFGAGSDLQIYHDGSNSYISESNATGNLFIKGTHIYLQNSAGQDAINLINGDAFLKSAGSTKLATTATGIDVTGTATMDGLTVDTSASTPVVINRNQAVDGYGIILNQANTTDGNGLEISYQATTTGTVTPNTPFAGIDFTADTHDWSTRLGSIQLKTAQGGVGYKTRMNVAGNGDVSFFESTGTTPKFFWDASAESLGIGTSSLTHTLQVNGASNEMALFKRTAAGNSEVKIDTTTSGDAKLTFANNGTSAYTLGRDNSDSSFRIASGGTIGVNDRLVIDSSGNVLVGKTSASFSTAGQEFRQSGVAVFGTSGGEALHLNRLGSDGGIVSFRKDNTVVGIISSRAGVVSTIILNPASGNGAGLSGGTKTIVPADEAGIIDNDISLGISTHRFKDLHLSGTASVGGLVVNAGTPNVAATFTSSDDTVSLVLTDNDTTNKIHSSATGLRFEINGSETGRFDSAGLDVTGDIVLGDSNPTITMNDSSIANMQHIIASGSDKFLFSTDPNQVHNNSRIEFQVDGTEMLQITDTGIDVTGTATMDGLTVDGNDIFFNNGWIKSNSSLRIDVDNDNNATDRAFFVSRGNAAADMLSVAETGDVSFFESTGTTPKFFWDASEESLGIGTSSPNYALDLQYTSGGALARFKDSDSIHNGIVIGGDVNAGWVGNSASNTGEGIYYQNSSNAMRVYTNSAERMRIDSSGQVGIGTSSPASALDVVGTITADGLTVDGTGLLQANVGAKLEIKSTDNFIDANEIIGSVDFISADYNNTAQPVKVQLEARAFNNLGSGDLYISTTNAATKADRIRVAYNGDISFYEDTGTTPKFFWDASAESLGIGTSSPYFPFNVHGTNITYGSARTTGLFFDKTSATTGTGGGVAFGGYTNGTGGTIYHFGNIQGIKENATAGNSAGALLFSTRANGVAPVEAMRIDSSGNVGIGTSTPSGALEVVGGSSLGSGFTQSRSGHPTFGITNGGTDSVYFSIAPDGGAQQTFMQVRDDDTDVDSVAFSTSGTEAMRIDSSGNVGIGTSSPIERLSVVAEDDTSPVDNGFSIYRSVGDDKVTINAQGGAARFIADGGSTDIPTIFSRYSGTTLSESMRIDSSGNVGIGTSTPDSISSSVSSLSLGGTNAGISGGITYQVNGAIKAYHYVSSDFMLHQAIAGVGHRFLANNTEAMRIDSSGNVLVGTTSSTLFSSSSQTGTNITAQGGLYIAHNGTNFPVFNRITSDGLIADFRKNGASIGSIGTESATTVIDGHATASGIKFDTYGVLPRKSGAIANDSVDLGSATVAWQDLYLSGTIQTATAGTSNFRAGVNAGNSITAGGNYNVVVGDEAGTANTTGHSNVAVGYQSLDANTSGIENTAVGRNALGANTTGAANVAVGVDSLLTNSTGSSNTFVGNESGKLVTTGSSNQAMGTGALENLTSGNSNVGIGVSAGAYTTLLTTGSNNVLVGHVVHTSAAGTDYATGVGFNLSCEGGYTTLGQDASDIRAAHGNVTWATVSDERYKQDIVDSTAGLSFINALRPRTFKYKTLGELPETFGAYEADSTDVFKNSDTNHGFIAQEVKAAIDADSSIADGFRLWDDRADGSQEVAEAALIPILVKAIQEQNALIEALTARITTLEG